MSIHTYSAVIRVETQIHPILSLIHISIETNKLMKSQAVDVESSSKLVMASFTSVYKFNQPSLIKRPNEVECCSD